MEKELRVTRNIREAKEKRERGEFLWKNLDKQNGENMPKMKEKLHDKKEKLDVPYKKHDKMADSEKMGHKNKKK